MTISQQRNKGRETFDKKFHWQNDNGIGDREDGCSTELIGYKVKSFIDKLYIDIVKGEIERLEGEKKGVGVIGEILTTKEDGYNQHIEEKLEEWQSQLQELEKEL